MAIARRLLAPGACLLIAWAGACGRGGPPPELDETLDGSAGVEDGATLIPDQQPPPPACPKLIGPDGGVCACLEEPLLTETPNLYFVLDRSGSMQDLDKWGTVQSVIGVLMEGLGPRAKFGAAVFPSRYDSTGCTPGGQVFALQRGDSPAGTEGPATASMLQTLRSIAAAGGTPTAATLSGLKNQILSLPGKTYVILATDGGPNCDSGARCTAAQCTYNIEGDNGCTASGPNCCDPAVSGVSDTWLACLDAQPTIAAVQSIAQGGIPVYVVGLPGAEPYAALLDQLAIAGGTSRGGEPQYYAVSSGDEAALEGALRKIAAKITGTCTFDIGAVPPDPSLVNVFLDEQVLPQQGPDGWTLAGSKLTILGASCAAILDGDVLDIRVFAGCPTVLR